jgi:hypothetical protein
MEISPTVSAAAAGSSQDSTHAPQVQSYPMSLVTVYFMVRPAERPQFLTVAAAVAQAATTALVVVSLAFLMRPQLGQSPSLTPSLLPAEVEPQDNTPLRMVVEEDIQWVELQLSRLMEATGLVDHRVQAVLDLSSMGLQSMVQEVEAVDTMAVAPTALEVAVVVPAISPA